MKLQQKVSFFGLLSFLFFPFIALSQYPPQAGNIGTSAIHRDSSIIKTFENYFPESEGKTLLRGWQSIADTSLGKANVGSLDTIFSPIGMRPFLISLGDGGSLTIELPYAIYDGSGPDFAIFENGFPYSKDSFFLELAFVEVSADGKKFYRFPAFSETDTSIQVGTFGSLKAEKIHNLAGKYIMPYGVPFDLADLKDSIEIPGKTTEIRFIRLIDVVGSIHPEYASRDLLGRIINDPWPTPFPSGGFDLSGIGFIHSNILGNSSEIKIGDNKLNVYPNPIADNSVLHIESKIAFEKISITDSNGKLKLEKTGLNQTLMDLDLHELNTGIFFVQLAHANQSLSFFKLIKL